jgi:hypothetical protein
MKLKTITTILILLILTTIGTAQPNSSLPTKNELTNFLRSANFTTNYTSTISELAVVKHPTWKWDIWELNDNSTMISFYYAKDPGYGAIYVYNNGTRVESLCYLNNTLVKSYTGLTTVNVSKPNVTDGGNVSKPNITVDVNCSVNVSEPNVSQLNNTTVGIDCINDTNNTTIGNNSTIKPEDIVVQKEVDYSKWSRDDIIKQIMKLLSYLSWK